MKLDSYGDIFFLIVGLIGLYVFERQFFIDQLTPILITIGTYTLQLLNSLLKFNHPTDFPTLLARGATILQVLFLVWMFFFQANVLLFYLAFIFSVLEVAEEILITFLLREAKPNILGIWQWKKSGVINNQEEIKVF